MVTKSKYVESSAFKVKKIQVLSLEMLIVKGVMIACEVMVDENIVLRSICSTLTSLRVQFDEIKMSEDIGLAS